MNASIGTPSRPAKPRRVGLPPLWRLPLLLLGMFSLVIGLFGGLNRLGAALPVPSAHAAVQHGVLMVCGFFGTLICLERAVALKALWAYAAPLASATGALLMLTEYTGLGVVLLVCAGALLCAASYAVHTRQPVLFTKVLLAGACSWLIGNAIMGATGSVHAAEPWWVAFFVLTIAGERLELNRMLAPRYGAQSLFLLTVVGLLAGVTLVTATRGTHPSLFGAALVAMALWLMYNDIARRTIRGEGLPRYIAASLLSGYGWMLTGGMLGGWSGSVEVTPFVHDAFLHAVLVGFVFSMVFGHAPIILPAVLGVRLRYTAWLYFPLGILHVSLACRIAGDLAASMPLRTLGSVLNAAAILLFAAIMLWLVATARTGQTSAR